MYAMCSDEKRPETTEPPPKIKTAKTTTKISPKMNPPSLASGGFFDGQMRSPGSPETATGAGWGQERCDEVGQYRHSPKKRRKTDRWSGDVDTV